MKDAGASIAGAVTGPPDRRKSESNPTDYWERVQADLKSQSKPQKKGGRKQ